MDGWADMMKTMATFHNSANKSKNWDESTTTAITENLYWNWLLMNANSLHVIYSKLENNMSRKTLLILWRSKWHMTFGITGYVNMSTKFDVWLTVHRSSMWNKKPTRCHLVLYLFLLYKLLNMFWATLCPSSGADDLVVFLPRVV